MHLFMRRLIDRVEQTIGIHYFFRFYLEVYFWYKRFKDGRKSISDDSRSGRPLMSTTDRNIGQVRDLIVADRKITIDNK
ncbi:hypothetical protein LAZ67_13001759 [Cordylochernes scorpioides]|uniref:Uncharacterized protein n=1 Tax=Cordylochernes scorpioides TaxID=51811 RepID=A0ABY6L436_9ARAC|nr:hypothetical protein LAZ67_13001759 [Cordylochernes scorpioides]